MLTLNSPQVVQETALRWKRDHKIALVPTMGALHEAHLRLVARAREFAPTVIVSIFVNPLQFGPSEDFKQYPRTFEQDVEKLDSMKIDLLFCPGVKDLYPEGFASRALAGNIAEPLEGKSRPGHFEGVATVCLKLFQITQADFAIFGEKDFQQLRVIQRVTSDFNLPITIIPEPTVRESDGLALSSRNRYLSPEERRWASKIPEALGRARDLATRSASVRTDEVLNEVKAILMSAPLVIDYVAIASARDLVPLDGSIELATIPSPHLLIAVRAGKTRLIDNTSLDTSDCRFA